MPAAPGGYRPVISNHCVFPPNLDSVPAARHFVLNEVGDGWGDEGVAARAALLVSELVTNAVLHARTDINVVVSKGDRRVRVEVADQNGRLPSHPDIPDDATSGRGMLLVDALACAWGIEERPDGKVIWFEVAVEGVKGARPS